MISISIYALVHRAEANSRLRRRDSKSIAFATQHARARYRRIVNNLRRRNSRWQAAGRFPQEWSTRVGLVIEVRGAVFRNIASADRAIRPPGGRPNGGTRYNGIPRHREMAQGFRTSPGGGNVIGEERAGVRMGGWGW